jgi:hypothetical protein
VDGADNKIANEPLTDKIRNIIRKQRSITSAINLQPSLSYIKKEQNFY